MRKTKNEELIKEIIECCNNLEYYTYEAHRLLGELRSITLTKTEEEKYNTKERLIEDLESFTY